MSGGQEQAARDADLAAKPATARFVCRKIAATSSPTTRRRPWSRDWRPAWIASGGDLGRVAERWSTRRRPGSPLPAKFKTPYEFVVSSYRAVGAEPSEIGKLAPVLTGLGQKPFSAPSPKGWPEEAEAWAAPDAIVKRMQFARPSPRRRGPFRPKALAAGPGRAADRPPSPLAVARAETRREAIALLLMSPEFQRR
jgi:uncharacterized protein (DUF1800 family)